MVKIFAYTAILLITIGCTSKPLVTLEYQGTQRKIMGATHWDRLADRVVTNLLCSSAKPDQCGQTQSTEPSNQPLPNGRPLYIDSAAPDMVFSDTFRMYLRKSLLERGFSVSKSRENADVLSFRVQRFLYAPETGFRFPFSEATFWTSLTAVGWAVRHSGISKSQAIGGLLVAGPILDFLNEMGKTTNAEVVITAFVENDRTIPFIYTEEFYVRPGDLHLYWTDFPVVPMGEQGPMLADPPRPRVIHTAAR